MKPSAKKKFSLFLILLCFFIPLLYYAGRPLPIEQRRELYPGVVYYRKVHFSPYLMIAHIVTVDLKRENISFLVTPGERGAPLPLTARTTSQFLNEFDLQIAVNGDGFSPWYANHVFDYYPHAGERVAPNGFAASQGVSYSASRASGPTLYISENNHADFRGDANEAYNAISGDRFIVSRGEPVEGLDDTYPAPRTAIGLDSSGEKMIIIVVDGRQPLYSSGATMAELARLLVTYGAEQAVNFDGGGSSTLVFENSLGWGTVVNSPIHASIPGLQRPVGNHLGIYVK